MGFQLPQSTRNISVELKMGMNSFGDDALCLYYGDVNIATFSDGDDAMVLCQLEPEDIDYLQKHGIRIKKTKFITTVAVS